MIQLRKNKTNFLIIKIIVLILLISSTLTVYRIINPVYAQNKTIIVPEEYSTISEAVKNANPYDTIFVNKGTYYENIWIDKPLEVIGEESKRTTVVGNCDSVNKNVFTVASDNVIIRGFTIKSTNYLTPK